MAAVHTLHAMTLGQQTAKMYNIIQPTTIIVAANQQQQQQPQQPVGHHHHQTKRPLAPAPERSSVLVSSSTTTPAGKRKLQFMPYGAGGPVHHQQQQPASVARRNARERNRVKQVNNGFATLRQHIPASVAQAFAPQGAAAGTAASAGRGASKKLSKVETLRLAVEYIRSLQQLIDESEGELMGSVSGGVESGAAGGAASLDGRYYTASPTDPLGHQQYPYPILLPTPTCSEASSSPTPSSHSSDGSFSTASGYTTALYAQQENFENYDPKSPEDEELLDAIFSWQQN